MLINEAFAQTAAPAPQGLDWIGFMPLVLMFVLLYFMMIRPQMKRSKEHKSMIDTLQKGDEVVTSGGMLGKVTKVGETYVTLEVADNMQVQVQKTAVQTVLPKGTIKTDK
jgi:preprotein translocase subunit YajC